MKRLNNSGRIVSLLNLLALALTAAAYAPFVFSARYALFHGDDFSLSCATFGSPVANLLAEAMKNAWLLYTTWQGTWLSNILSPLLNPLNWYSFSLLRLLMMGCMIAGFVSLCVLCRELGYCLGKKKYMGILTALFLLPMLYSRTYTEVYLWHVGSMAYLVPLTLQILGFAFLLRMLRKDSKALLVLACVFLFLSGGGVLLIGGLGAWLTLLLFLVDWLEKRKPDKRFALCFLAVFAGDLANVLAPGNYVKASGELHIVKAISGALTAVMYEAGFQLSHFLFAAALLCALLLGLGLGKKLRRESFALAVCGLLLTPVVVPFPLMLGYDFSSVNFISDRGWFVIDSAIFFCFLTAAFLLGGQCRGMFEERTGKAVKRTVASAAAVLFLLCLPAAKTSAPIQVAENLRNGKIQAYAAEWHEIFDMLSMRPGENVVVEVQPDSCVGVFAVTLGASPDHAMNYHLARYFGNASIVDAWYANTYGVPNSGPGAEEDVG